MDDTISQQLQMDDPSRVTKGKHDQILPIKGSQSITRYLKSRKKKEKTEEKREGEKYLHTIKSY